MQLFQQNFKCYKNSKIKKDINIVKHQQIDYRNTIIQIMFDGNFRQMCEWHLDSAFRYIWVNRITICEKK